MNWITVASPDKISLSMFTSYLKACLPDAPSYEVFRLNSLMSAENIDTYMDEVNSKADRGIIIYYAKRAVNKDPNQVIPSRLLNCSDVVVWLELYATDFRIVKDESGFESDHRERWRKNIERMNKIRGV